MAGRGIHPSIHPFIPSFSSLLHEITQEETCCRCPLLLLLLRAPQSKYHLPCSLLLYNALLAANIFCLCTVRLGIGGYDGSCKGCHSCGCPYFPTLLTAVPIQWEEQALSKICVQWENFGKIPKLLPCCELFANWRGSAVRIFWTPAMSPQKMHVLRHEVNTVYIVERYLPTEEAPWI